MRKRYLTIYVCAFLYSLICGELKADSNEDEAIATAFADLSGKIQNNHPRLFINEAILSDIKTRAIEQHSEHFRKTKDRIDGILQDEIVFLDPTITDGTKSKDHEYGFRASDAALLYLVTNNQVYLEYTKKVLRKLGQYYTFRNEQKLNIHWYAYSRISALSAFDWIYTDLTESERTEIGQPLLYAINTMIPDGIRPPFPRENRGDFKSGYYGTPTLAWYAGLVFYKTGIDDQLSEQLLKKGFEDHWKLLAYRKAVAGSDGGSSTATMEYNIQAYPWAEFNFFHTIKSATNEDISQQWTSPIDFLYYVAWNWLPGNHHFGYGDVDHFNNRLPLNHMYIHLSQIKHFYKDNHPEVMPLLNWIYGQLRQQTSDAIPFARYLLNEYYTEACGGTAANNEYPDFPSAMHFENMGQIFMRSGSGNDDTYAMFSAGGILTQHRHYDNNNFVIYKKGFRALDSGTRPEPGQHLTHYYCRTIAHNCILIRMPGEEFPAYWGGPAASETPLPIPNDGGQREIIGSTLLGYCQNNQYVYVASDATAAYHTEKADEVVRQFVFIQPDLFVVFDKVVSKSADYKKTWLLHTAEEPVFINNNEFFDTYGDGKLFCRTVFPIDAQVTKIGGYGKQFWSDDRNWPLPVNEGVSPRDTIPLFGQWRVEVSPDIPKQKDSFLHLIQVGNDSLNSMITSHPIEQQDKKGISFTYMDKSYEILFFEQGTIGGSIRISKDGNTILEESFTNQVEPQKSIFQN